MKAFREETRSIERHVEILARQVGQRNPFKPGEPGSDYVFAPYTPGVHVRNDVERVVEKSGYDRGDISMFLDAALLCSLCADRHLDLLGDSRSLTRAVSADEFESAVFRERFNDSDYQRWLVLVAYFVDVWVCEQQAHDRNRVVAVLVAAPIIPEYFTRRGEPSLDKVPFNPSDTGVVYVDAVEHGSGADDLLRWMYLTECSSRPEIEHVVLVAPRDGLDWRTASITRNKDTGRFFDTRELVDALEANALPGTYASNNARDYDYDDRGRRVVQSPQLKPRHRKPARKLVLR